jgi:uncharacterized protein DUF3379
VNCEHARELLHAEPARRTPELSAHLAACPECAALAARLAAFDTRLHRALSVPVPPAPAVGAVARAGVRRVPHWFALAASGLLVAVALGITLSIYPREALASALVGHIAGEPDSWSAEVTVADGALGEVLRRSGVTLATGGPRVTYAQSCRFRGWLVPHLVVQTGSGPMTVIVLAHEHVSRATPIDEGGYRGVIVPAGRGAVAVLARGAGDAALPAAVAAEAAGAIRFTD